MVHVDVPEGDVVDDAAADGADGGADAAHADPLEQHVLRGRLVVVLHRDAVVLTTILLLKCYSLLYDKITTYRAEKICLYVVW